MSTPGPVSPRWKPAFFAVLGLWLLTLGASAYMLLDAGVTEAYTEAQQVSDREDFTLLTRLAPSLRRGTTQADVLSLIREQNPTALVSSKAGHITVGQLAFHFGPDGLLASITQDGSEPSGDSLRR